jgi:SAM-dependent methyltransferase
VPGTCAIAGLGYDWLVAGSEVAAGRGQVGRLPDAQSPYWTFYDAVASRQLDEWIPRGSGWVLDLSGPHGRAARQLVAAGHRVLRVLTGRRPEPSPPAGVRAVVCDPLELPGFADESLDAVVAESREFSQHLVLEITMERLARVLRGGGRLLFSVDSLLLGLARLAGQGRWAELASVPDADVVLVPTREGAIRRCFWPEELTATLTGAGLLVDWVRPRTVLSVPAVEAALRADPGRCRQLVETELTLARRHGGEPLGSHLVVAAHKPDG